MLLPGLRGLPDRAAICNRTIYKVKRIDTGKLTNDKGTLCNGWRMKLKDWRIGKGLSIAQLAAELGCTRQAVYRYEAGATPEAAIVIKAHELSGGEVCPNDLYGLHPPAAEPELPLELEAAA